MIAKVGADIESLCRKCGDVWHVVVAMVGSKIAKVQCKQCGGQHRHRPPDGSTGATAPRRSSASRAKPKAKKVEVVPEPQVQPNLSRPERLYALSDSYAVGDRIDHRVFGHGVVQRIVGREKIEVSFPTGPKVLAHERQ